ncbi:hypothetical protein ACQR5V_07175 [Xanthomonas oryzae pv. oryzicola]|uniref:hypothetical protein n=1 Tax=Xanthomonas oryzae TaxID=347 RepID=UPI0013791344|nr:hypothetical protein [Xanthomonas oryzae]
MPITATLSREWIARIRRVNCTPTKLLWWRVESTTAASTLIRNTNGCEVVQAT